jgi:hypothetical protein
MVFRGVLFCFPAAHVSGAVYLSFRWYSVRCFILFTCLLFFGYCHVDFLTLHIYCITSDSILSFCDPMACALLLGACENRLVEILVWRSRSSSSGRSWVMELWINVFVQRKQTHRDQNVHLAGFKLSRSGSSSSSSRNPVMEIWSKVFVQY